MTEEDRERMLVEARAWYDKAAADGIDALFEPRQDRCPWCRSSNLRLRLRSRELIQLKPGTFSLDECRGCGHVFQNPRLERGRARLLLPRLLRRPGRGDRRDHVRDGRRGQPDPRPRASRRPTPGTWLDVGTGHGHFCLHAKEVLPDTAFDGLDLGDGSRRGRADRAGSHGGTAACSPTSRRALGSYDVVSMHHYLEHTRDPRAELDAAATVLEQGGYCRIEMPAPSTASLGSGGWWVPWFQPQHQHFMPAANLLGA